MADANPLSLGGSLDGADFAGSFGTDNALWLEQFGGEVLAAYEKQIEIAPRLMERTIAQGKSASFPIHGRVNSRFHRPGESIYDESNTARAYQDAISTGAAGDGRPQGWTADTAATYLSNPGAAKKVINVNDLLLASIFVDGLDEMKAHYDLRSSYSVELGRGLARKLDNLACRAICAAAEGAASGPMLGGGSVAGIDFTQADSIVSGILAAVQTLDEKDVPAEERFCIVNPAGYHALLKAGAGLGTDNYAALLNKDYSLGNGDFAQGRVLMVGGVPVIMSNNTGFGVDFTTTDAGEQNGLGVDMTAVRGLVAHKQSAGIVKVQDVTLEEQYDISRQGHLFVAKVACGLGALRTDAAVKLTS